MFDVLNNDLDINNLYFSKDKYQVLEKFLKIILQSQSISAKLILSEVKKINDRLYIFLLDHKFESVWPSITSSKNQKQFERQFHKWFDFLKTIKLLKFK